MGIRRQGWVGLHVLALLVVLTVTRAQGGAEQHLESSAQPTSLAASYVPGEVLIGWQPGAIAVAPVQSSGTLGFDRDNPDRIRAGESLEALAGLAVLDIQPEYGTARLVVPEGREAAEIARLRALPWIEYAELNHIAHATGYSNDPFISNQWNLRRIEAPAAWDVTDGSYSIVVAVLDSGVDMSHPEFAGRLVQGYDFVNQDNTPEDDYGHGTHVTGIMAAAVNDGIGIAGLVPKVKILPLKVLDASGGGSYGNIALAIRRAADSMAQVINLSLGGTITSDDLHAAVSYAAQRNALVVSAAGNCGQPVAGCNYQANPNFYPAAYPEVLAVGATDHYDRWAPYSGFKSYIGLAAPGGLPADPIWSTERGGYGFRYGTSMATPLVSGAAALVWTRLPAASNSAVADILKNTADKVGVNPYVGGRNDTLGSGRLNVRRAVRWAYPPSIVPMTATQYFLLGSELPQQIVRLPLVNPSDRLVLWSTAVAPGADWLTALPADGMSTYSSPGILTLTAGPAALAAGHYTGTVQVRINATQPISFSIPVRMEMAGALRRSFVPAVTVNHMSADWIDISAGGQILTLSDNRVQEVPLPFPVPYYEVSYNAMWVSDNGWISFSQPDSAALSAQPACVPSALSPNNAIYVLWQDWKPGLGGQVYVQPYDADRYVITWSGMLDRAGGTPHSFQLVLMGDGRQLLQYQAIQAPLEGTLGAENFDGTLAETLVCGGTGRPIGSGDAVFLQPRSPWSNQP